MLILRVPHTMLASSEQRQKLVDVLFTVLENKPELKAHIESVQPQSDDSSKVVVYVTQRDLGRVKSSQLAAFFKQPAKLTMLETQLRVDKEQIVPIVQMDSQHKKLYLSTVPTGMDEALWEAGIRHNPDPARFIPVPVRGFEELRLRQKEAIAQVAMQGKALVAMNERSSQLDASVADAKGRLARARLAQKELSHRLLRVAAMQLISARFAHGLDENEEGMQAALEHLHAKINAPNHLKSRLFDLKQSVDAERDSLRTVAAEKTAKAPETLNQADVQQLRRYLSKCQDGLESLVDIVNQNLCDIRTMEQVVRI